MKVDLSTLAIVPVNGTPMRVAPLIVRGPERRRMAISKPVRVVLEGVFDGHTITVVPPRAGEIPVVLRSDGQDVSLFTMQGNSSRFEGIDRRSGKERRKA